MLRSKSKPAADLINTPDNLDAGVLTDCSPDSSPVGFQRLGQPSLFAAWRWWAVPALLSFILALIFLDPFAGDWDALDYTVLALRGEPSSMILGRSLFIFTNHLLWQIAHAVSDLPVEKAYLLFKYAVVAQTPLAIIACWALARELTNSIATATVASLLIALSPYFITYSGQVMTEIPSLLLLAIALTIHLRGVRERQIRLVIAGACLLGMSVNVREMALLYAPWLVVAPIVYGWTLEKRQLAITALACSVFLIFAFGGFAYWFLADVDGYRGHWFDWLEQTRRESARHPVTSRNLHTLLRYFVLAAPMVAVALPFAAVKEWRARGFSPLIALAFIGLLSNLALIFHYSLVLNWRYLLTGLPALAPLVADYFLSWQEKRLGNPRIAFVSVVLLAVFFSGVISYWTWPTNRNYIEARAMARDYLNGLAHVPHDALMISGGQTVAVNYWRGLGAGQWNTIGSGAGWPGAQLGPEIEGELKTGHRVFLDTDSRWWSPCGWQTNEIRDLVTIESRFRFRQITETIYEIKPRDDVAASDAPALQNLLPENRPAESRLCAKAE